MNDVQLHPLKFQPILKDKIWGGSKLKTYLHKETTSNQVGESWEISDVEGDCSIVANGSLKGTSLKELIDTYKENLVGEKIYQAFGNKFPLLIKFIDAKENLSVQLHPDDKLAKERHNSFGKTEMWYIMQADQDCGIIVGFKNGIEIDDYNQALQQNILAPGSLKGSSLLPVILRSQVYFYWLSWCLCQISSLWVWVWLAFLSVSFIKHSYLIFVLWIRQHVLIN